MDIETKEAVLKLAGYRVESDRLLGRAYRFMQYEVITDTAPDQDSERLAIATTREAAINVAYNAFLTRQNETTES